METAVQEQGVSAPAAVVAAPVQPTNDGTQDVQNSQNATPEDPYLSGIAAEHRPIVEPIYKKLKEDIAKDYEKKASEFAPLKEKATALDQLVSDPRFQGWYRTNVLGYPQPQQVQPQQQISPQDEMEFLRQELVANANDPIKYAETLGKINERTVGESLRALNQKTTEMELASEFDSLVRKHPDVWELDKAGMMEPYLYYYKDMRGLPMEQAYMQAKKAYDFFTKKSEAQALGMVQSKKNDVTEKPSTSSSNAQPVVYAHDKTDALRKQLIENLPGGLRRKVVIQP